jgi:hypothetical protein
LRAGLLQHAHLHGGHGGKGHNAQQQHIRPWPRRAGQRPSGRRSAPRPAWPCSAPGRASRRGRPACRPQVAGARPAPNSSRVSAPGGRPCG